MKRRLLFILKTCVSIIIIGFILYKADRKMIAVSLQSFSMLPFLLMVGALILNNLGQVLRWKVLLSESLKGVQTRKLIQYHMIAVFFQSFLPSSMSADLVKGYLLSKATDKSKAYGSVLFARFLGMAVLILFFLLVFLFKPAMILDKGFTREIITGLALISLGCIVIFSKKVSRFLFGRFTRLSQTKIFQKAKAFREELYAYRNNLPVLVLALLLSMAIFILSILAGYYSFKAVGAHIPLLACMIYIPLVYAFMLMPISLNGIGLREGLLLLFLSPWGLTYNLVLTSSVLAYLVIYGMAIIGGIIYLFSDIKGVFRVQEKE